MTSFTYDSTYGRLTGVTDPLNYKTSIVYEDPVDVTTQPDVEVMTYPLGHVTT